MEQTSRSGFLQKAAIGGLAGAGVAVGAGALARNAYAVTASDLVVSVADHGATGDGTTDDSTAVLDAIAEVSSLGGGTVFFPQGTFRIDSQLTFPSTLEVLSRQAPIRLTGQGGHYSGNDGTNIYGGSVLDLRYSGSVAKIDTRGFGILEIDRLVLLSGGEDDTPIIQTTNTTLHIHDTAFESLKRGTDCDVDAIILGGTQPAQGDGPLNGFQGYGTVIRENFFQGIRRAAYFRTWANGIIMENNSIWVTSGSNLEDGAAIELDGCPDPQVEPIQYAIGNVIAGNLIEVLYYPYAIKLQNAQENTLVYNNFYDAGGGGLSIAGIRFEDEGLYNLVIDGFVPGNLNGFSEAVPRSTRISRHQNVPSIFAQPVMFSSGARFEHGAEMVGLPNHVIALQPTDSLRTGLSTTAGRPSAAAVDIGAQYYDIDLHQPIWSNGSSWRDAMGNAV